SRKDRRAGRRYRLRRARVRAALRPAAFRAVGPFVRTALRAAADRAAAPRFFAADLVCFASAPRDAAPLPSRFKTPLIARERVGEVFFPGCLPRAVSFAAFLRVVADCP